MLWLESPITGYICDIVYTFKISSFNSTIHCLSFTNRQCMQIGVVSLGYLVCSWKHECAMSIESLQVIHCL